MRIPTLIAWLLGLALLATLVALHHPGRTFDAVAALRGWLVLIVAFHAVPLLVDVVAWRSLFADPPPLLLLMRIRWMAEGVNGLFPVPHMGELLRVDLVRRSTGGDEVGASVVDLTLGVTTQIPFTALGLAHEVIHTTDAYFAYARTAMRVGTRANIPIASRLTAKPIDGLPARPYAFGDGSPSGDQKGTRCSPARTYAVAAPATVSGEPSTR